MMPDLIPVEDRQEIVTPDWIYPPGTVLDADVSISRVEWDDRGVRYEIRYRDENNRWCWDCFAAIEVNEKYSCPTKIYLGSGMR